MTRVAWVLVALVGCAPVHGVDWPPSLHLPILPVASRLPEDLPTSARVDQPAPPLVPAPDVSGCPSDMVAVDSFCVDRYEAPNVEGELPFALQTAHDGEAWCAARQKRLCTEIEWVRACSGPRGSPFPYGEQYRQSTCNDDRAWIPVRWKTLGRWPQDAAMDEAARLFQADMSGARAGCVSEEGVFDLSGNVAEWVRRSKPSGRPGYDHVLKGCFWAGCFKGSLPGCGFVNGAHPGTFRTYEAGFRCCAARSTAIMSRP